MIFPPWLGEDTMVYVSGSPLASDALALPRTIASPNVSVGWTVMGFAVAAVVTLAPAAAAAAVDALVILTAAGVAVELAALPPLVRFDTVAAAECPNAFVTVIADPLRTEAPPRAVPPLARLAGPASLSARATADPLANAAPTPRLSTPAPSQLNARV